jgi:S1-C subfamily serine protease
MHKKRLVLPVLLVVMALFASACSSTLAALQAITVNETSSELVDGALDDKKSDQDQSAAPAAQIPVEPGLLAAYENTLTNIYEQVNPSVVNIRVIGGELPFLSDPGQLPPLPEMPEIPEGQLPPSSSLGSGFVWDEQGNIITNNHVIAGADEIEVTFADESVVNAEVIGTDPDSDLAVIKVDVPAQDLIPIQLAQSGSTKVGQLAIAIGNPFGLEGTMTVGIVSALGRSIRASDGFTAGPVYNIPNVIQTDAPINPGNSGGVLLNASGELIGVTTAIESPVRANAGIGFVIPTSIVERVVPELIENGSFAHPFLGITGISLFPDLAEAMDLDKEQRGAMVAEVVPDGPADKAGLQGSDSETSVEGVSMGVGGDVIVAINNEAVQDMDDLIAYLSANTIVDQEVTLLVIRDGSEVEIDVTLEARPEQNIQASHPVIPAVPPASGEGRAWLGIVGIPLTPEIAREMELAEDQAGVLILQIQPDSPAQGAGLLGSDQEVTINGETVLIGGDVITRADGNDVSDIPQLAAYLQEVGAGEQVTLTVLRNGELLTIEVELEQQP